MKVSCPQCQAVSEIDDGKVPDQGAWGRCPKCGHKIFVSKHGGDAPPIYSTRVHEPDLEEEYETARVVHEKPTHSGCLMISVASAILVVVVLYLGFGVSPSKDTDQEQVKLRFSPTFYEGLTRVRGRLAQRYDMRSDHRVYTANADSLETRMIGEIMTLCQKNCATPHQVEIYPSQTPEGFEAYVWCDPGEDPNYLIQYDWVRDTAAIGGKFCR